MNVFDQKLKETPGLYPMMAGNIKTFAVNLGYKCNLRCTHCHVESSPERTEEMSLETVNKILDILRNNSGISTLDITGGAVELNPHFRYLAKSAADLGRKVIAVSNLTLFSEPGMEDLPEFLAENRVLICTSLPCVTEEGVERQRGKGTYKKIISGLKRLNEVGYGKGEGSIELDIIFNPVGASTAPDERLLEEVYREKLFKMYGITFSHLFAQNNMPIGRLGKSVSRDELITYMKELEEKYNPKTAETLMCRYLLSVSPDEKLYDCDFMQALRQPVRNGNATLDDFDYDALSSREIGTTEMCLVCTARTGDGCYGLCSGESGE